MAQSTGVLSILQKFSSLKSHASDYESKSTTRPLTHIQKLNLLYKLPAPLQTFPLPNLVPHNPLSLLHIIYVWVNQIISPSPSLILPLYHGWFSVETRSVHVTDDRSIRGLWEQGFFGKGSLSRSEPNWLDGEKARRSNKKATTSEEFTKKRREERQKMKWERARKERQAIDQKLLEEAQSVRSEHDRLSSVPLFTNEIPSLNHFLVSPIIKPPIGPVELLALPNSQADLKRLQLDSQYFHEELINAIDNKLTCQLTSSASSDASIRSTGLSTSGVSCLPNDIQKSFIPETFLANSVVRPINVSRDETILVTNHLEIDEVSEYLNRPQGSDQLNNVFERTAVSCPPLISNAKLLPTSESSSASKLTSFDQKSENIQREHHNSDEMARSTAEDNLHSIRNEEHFQLTLEEAFFLRYTFGCLQVKDPVTNTEISTESLFQLCRQNSFFPPRSSSDLSSDDPFLINYIVYHHFRSLGWVVRSGIKFSVDYMLYNRGPVFSHAEFAVLILPSYSDPYWSSTASLKDYSSRKQYRSWAWMSCINRVISQVKKTLILCYVDIPRPLSLQEEKALSLENVIARYKVREFVMRRFLTNRMRA